jgi:hypothetical protein
MRRFKSAPSAHRFLDAFARVGNLFRPGRHRLASAEYRAVMRERVATWRAVAGLRAASYRWLARGMAPLHLRLPCDREVDGAARPRERGRERRERLRRGGGRRENGRQQDGGATSQLHGVLAFRMA